MAATIKLTLGIKAVLLEGHGGIFEVSLNDKIIYSNNRECHQEFIPEIIVRNIGEAISSKNIPEKGLSCESGGG